MDTDVPMSVKFGHSNASSSTSPPPSTLPVSRERGWWGVGARKERGGREGSRGERDEGGGTGQRGGMEGGKKD